MHRPAVENVISAIPDPGLGNLVGGLYQTRPLLQHPRGQNADDMDVEDAFSGFAGGKRIHRQIAQLSKDCFKKLIGHAHDMTIVFCLSTHSLLFFFPFVPGSVVCNQLKAFRDHVP